MAGILQYCVLAVGCILVFAACLILAVFLYRRRCHRVTNFFVFFVGVVVSVLSFVASVLVCLCVCPCCKRQTTRAIDTKLGTCILYSSCSACIDIDPEVKRSKVKVTPLQKPSQRTVASDYNQYPETLWCATCGRCRRGSACRYDCLCFLVGTAAKLQADCHMSVISQGRGEGDVSDSSFCIFHCVEFIKQDMYWQPSYFNDLTVKQQYYHYADDMPAACRPAVECFIDPDKRRRQTSATVTSLPLAGQ